MFHGTYMYSLNLDPEFRFHLKYLGCGRREFSDISLNICSFFLKTKNFGGTLSIYNSVSQYIARLTSMSI